MAVRSVSRSSSQLRATLLSVSNVGVSFGATQLFKNITVTVAQGERWGITGRNDGVASGGS